jgi:isoquinoline 1-oxidoreductase subunit beta
LQPDGSVIVVAHRSEMGTGIRTPLPMVAAEELEADWQNTRFL